MGTVWFCLVAIMIAVYVLLDGFDVGAGAIHLLVAKTDDERRQVLASIGPVWDGNEVWILAAGGTLYFAFPALYASGFSGFYLPLMMVLSSSNMDLALFLEGILASTKCLARFAFDVLLFVMFPRSFQATFDQVDVVPRGFNSLF